MKPEEEAHYWTLSDQAQRGELRPDQPGEHALYGEAAVTRARQILMEATQADTIEDALQVARRGRPRLSPGQGRSPVARTRLAEDEDQALTELARRTGKSRSELIREGVRLRLAAA
ncbi:MAG: ribbon-helix-helix protein, CopG family [Bifidobacteriaceae bacterium]|jgi:hypothetical protein|nr:ribbon-helix-helix protein, CopG family [Bifidobacteriaceae bacterium]